MGKNIKKPFLFKNEKFIDYAVSDERSDFLDIWLIAKCFFIYGPGGGLIDMSTVFFLLSPPEHFPKDVYFRKQYPDIPSACERPQGPVPLPHIPRKNIFSRSKVPDRQ